MGIASVGFDVFVDTGNSFGVVYMDKTLSCATCKYGNTTCEHVTYLQGTIAEMSPEEIPSILIPFTNVCQSPQITASRRLTCVSQAKIPLELPEDLMAIFKMSLLKRFNLENDMACLAPPKVSSVSCPICYSASCWSDQIYLENECFLVAIQGLFQGKGNFMHISHTQYYVYYAYNHM